MKMLRDDISFNPKKKADEDAFDHLSYARTIYQILAENRPPLTIGLFARWGAGKSYVMRKVFDLIGDDNDPKFFPIYFKAWKYSGDSFRRQFLLEVANRVYENDPKKNEKIQRLEQLNYSEVLKEDDVHGFWERLKELLGTKVRLRQAAIARILIALFLFLAGWGISGVVESAYPFWSGLAMAAMAFVLKFKFEDLVLIQETPVFDPRMIFPEQFESEFCKLVAPSGPLDSKIPVIVIDDIDRCHSQTVRDILTSIKTFLGNEHCFILVPCDDRSIIKVFGDANQEDGYQEELLRKYFDVGIRMTPLIRADLVDFARRATMESGLPSGVIQIAALGNCRDARKMKHFINSFRIKQDLANRRNIPCSPDELAKALVIEDVYAEAYDMIAATPKLYFALEEAALADNDELLKEKLKPHDLEKWQTQYHGLKVFLVSTRDTKLKDPRLLFSLKPSNPETRLPDGVALREAIVSGDTDSVDDIIQNVTDAEAQADLASLLETLSSAENGAFLHNTIRIALRLSIEDEKIPKQQGTRLLKTICRKLGRGEGPPLLTLSPATVIASAQGDVGDRRLLANRYVKEIKGSEELPDDFAKFINTVVPALPDPSGLIAITNQQLAKWTETLHYLQQVAAIDLPDTLKDVRVPDKAVLKRIVTGFSPTAEGAAPDMNTLRKDILLRHWQADLIPIVSDKLTEMLKQANGEAEPWDGHRISLVREIVFNRHGVTHTETQIFWNMVKNACSRAKTSEEKLEAHRAALVFAIHSTHQPSRNDASTFLKTMWQAFTDEQAKIALKQVREYTDEERAELEKMLLDQELASCRNQIASPNERVFQRFEFCLEQKGILTSASVESCLDKTLDQPQKVFLKWQERIPEYAQKLTKGFCSKLCKRCLSLGASEADQIKKDGLFSLFAKILPLAENDAKDSLLSDFFTHCRHDDLKLRTSALSALEEIRDAVDAHDFRMSVNGLVYEMPDKVKVDQLPQWRKSFEQVLVYRASFGSGEWGKIGSLAQSALVHPNQTVREQGLFLVEAMDELPVDHEEDIVHQLIKLAGGPETAMSTQCKDLLRKFAKTEIKSKEAEGAIGEYLRELQKEETKQDEAENAESE
jgi:hypothetical protein